MTAPMYPNSLVQLISDAVQRRGRARVSDLIPEFPGYSKKQIHAALCNARDRSKVRMVSRGNWKNKTESVWEPGASSRPAASPLPTVKLPTRPPASVWDLPHIQLADDWPPQFDGGRVHVCWDDTMEKRP